MVYLTTGSLTHNWRSFTYAGNRTVREISSLVLDPLTGGNWTYTFTRDDAGDAGLSHHQHTTLSQPGGLGDRRWWFTADKRLSMYEERGAAGAVRTRTKYAWTFADLTHGENPYIWRVTNRRLYGATQARTRTEQSRDMHNNVLWTKVYDFNDADNAPSRTYTYQYLHDGPNGADYIHLFIRNRVTRAAVTQVGEPEMVLQTATYDDYSFGSQMTLPAGTVTLHHSGFNTSWIRRGNPRCIASSGANTCYAYDTTGQVRQVVGPDGTVNVTRTVTNNWTGPQAMTSHGVSTTLSWNSLLQLQTATGGNGDGTTFSWDILGRPTGRTNPDGSRTAITYTTINHVERTGRQYRNYVYDGLGRTIRVELGTVGSGEAVGARLSEANHCSTWGSHRDGASSRGS